MWRQRYTHIINKCGSDKLGKEFRVLNKDGFLTIRLPDAMDGIESRIILMADNNMPP
jgi:hypothetical protein